ncbi:hypothetical protein TNCV_4466591 [Trichonephila clavipes]|nr:hypothetical protein TNCV_4466591 [Trichonephila clavipes]
MLNEGKQDMEDESRNRCPSRSTKENNSTKVQDTVYFNNVDASVFTRGDPFQNSSAMKKVVEQLLASQSTIFCQSSFLKLFALDDKWLNDGDD